MATVNSTGPVWGRQPRSCFPSPTWVQRSKTLILLLCFPRLLATSWTRSDIHMGCWCSRWRVSTRHQHAGPIRWCFTIQWVLMPNFWRKKLLIFQNYLDEGLRIYFQYLYTLKYKGIFKIQSCLLHQRSKSIAD